LRLEAPDRTVWRTCYGRGCGTTVKQTRNDDDDNDDDVSGQELQHRKGSLLLFVFKPLNYEFMNASCRGKKEASN
jgi:hypothetical protein